VTSKGVVPFDDVEVAQKALQHVGYAAAHPVKS
jgi:hypothetical protein